MKIARMIVFVLLTATVGRLPLKAQCVQLLEDLRKGEITQDFELGDCPSGSLSKELQEEIEILTILYISNGNAEKIKALAKLELEIYEAYKGGPPGYSGARVARELVGIVNSKQVQHLLFHLGGDRDWKVGVTSGEERVKKIVKILSLAAELMPVQPVQPVQPVPEPGERNRQELEEVIGRILDQKLEERTPVVLEQKIKQEVGAEIDRKLRVLERVDHFWGSLSEEEKTSFSLVPKLKRGMAILGFVVTLVALFAAASIVAIVYLDREYKKRFAEEAKHGFVKASKFKHHQFLNLNTMAAKLSDGEIQQVESLGRMVLKRLDALTGDVQKIKDGIPDSRPPAGDQEAAEKGEGVEVAESRPLFANKDIKIVAAAGPGAFSPAERSGEVELVSPEVSLSEASPTLGGGTVPEVSPPARSLAEQDEHPVTMADSELASEVESLDGEIREILDRLRTLEEKPPVRIPVPRVQPQPPTLSKEIIREAAGDAVGNFEFEVLKIGWQKYVEQYDTEGELAQFLEKDSEWGGRRDILLLGLQPVVCNHDELKVPFEDILTPVKDFDKIVTKLSNIGRLVQGDLPRLDDPTKDLLRTRGFSNLLSQLQNSTGGSGLPRFDLRIWVSEKFCGFADLFLRVFQEARFNRDASLDSGYEDVRKVLSWADLEPIDIEIGQTRFDSSKHVGRGTEADPNLSEGSIVGVIRSGFRRVGGQVIQQPEVIVNRP